MTDLIAVLSTGKGTWGHVGRLIQEKEWNNILLITNEFGREKFSSEKETTMAVVDSRQSMPDLIAEIKSNLDGKLGDDVALNIISGSGKEHMALLAALKELNVNFKMIALTKEGIQEF